MLNLSIFCRPTSLYKVSSYNSYQVFFFFFFFKLINRFSSQSFRNYREVGGLYFIFHIETFLANLGESVREVHYSHDFYCHQCL